MADSDTTHHPMDFFDKEFMREHRMRMRLGVSLLTKPHRNELSEAFLLAINIMGVETRRNQQNLKREIRYPGEDWAELTPYDIEFLKKIIDKHMNI